MCRFLHAHFEFLCSAPPKICFWLVFPFSFSIHIRIATSSSSFSYFPFFPSYMGSANKCTVCFHSSICVCAYLHMCLYDTTTRKVVYSSSRWIECMWVRMQTHNAFSFSLCRSLCTGMYFVLMKSWPCVCAFDDECVFAMVDDGHPGYKHTMPNSYTCMECGVCMYWLAWLGVCCVCAIR